MSLMYRIISSDEKDERIRNYLKGLNNLLKKEDNIFDDSSEVQNKTVTDKVWTEVVRHARGILN